MICFFKQKHNRTSIRKQKRERKKKQNSTYILSSHTMGLTTIAHLLYNIIIRKQKKKNIHKSLHYDKKNINSKSPFFCILSLVSVSQKHKYLLKCKVSITNLFKFHQLHMAYYYQLIFFVIIFFFRNLNFITEKKKLKKFCTRLRP